MDLRWVPGVVCLSKLPASFLVQASCDAWLVQDDHWAARHAGTEAVLQYMRSDPDDKLSRLVPAHFLSGAQSSNIFMALWCTAADITEGCLAEEEDTPFLKVLQLHMARSAPPAASPAPCFGGLAPATPHAVGWMLEIERLEE